MGYATALACVPAEPTCPEAPPCPPDLSAELAASRAAAAEAERTVADLRAEVAALENTPSNALARALGLRAEGNSPRAEEAFREIVARFEGTDEAEQAEDLLDDIAEERAAAERAAAEAEAARLERERLGLRVLRASDDFEIGEVRIRVRDADTDDGWKFDRDGYQWRERPVIRGNQFVILNLTISSDARSPRFPEFRAYAAEGGQLLFLGALETRFYRWRDFGAYLGNYHDPSNDFTHTESIRFTVGAQVPEDILDETAVFILADRNPCVTRRNDTYGNPPVSYRPLDCTHEPVLTPDDVEAGYEVAHIFNARALR